MSLSNPKFLLGRKSPCHIQEALGPRHDEVQAEVNRILSSGKSSSGGSSVDVDALARRVIAGEFGNGDERENALGSNYSVVQKRVNELLS